jgi:hypothetical protein
MDDKAYQPERTPEEVAWDEEFRDVERRSSDVASDIAGLLRFAARIPVALMQMPMAILPDESVRHARASAREGFLAVRSLFSAIADNIEEMLTDPDPATARATVQGPEGTWGTGRAASASSGKVKRIELVDEGVEPSTAPGDMP